jgi:excisionase family DNA binding protein
MALKDEYFTISQAAKELATTRQTVARWIESGNMPAEKVGREKLIPREFIIQKKMQHMEALFNWVLWPLVEQSIAYRPKTVVIEGLVYQEPIRVIVTNWQDEAELFEIVTSRRTDKKSITEKTFQIHRVEKFQTPILKVIEPVMEIRLELDGSRNIVRATYTDIHE